jgi:transposase
MFLKKTPYKETGRTYLAIVKKVRNPKTGKAADVVVESIGYLDEQLKHHDDPIAHYQELARKMTAEEKVQRKATLTLDMDEELSEETDARKNLGYAAILKIYHELELDRILYNKARHRNFEYNTNSIMTLLVISRILSPGSKKKAFEEKGRYFERFNFTLENIYRALSHYATIDEEVQCHINDQITKLYGRDTTTIYYDVTNFYFEIDAEDELRKRGYGKEGRKDPLVQMGLAMDADGVPLHYELFEGNIPDKSTFRSVIGDVIRKYDTGRVIVVADMGIITGDNIYYLAGGEKRAKTLHGYIFSFSIRGGADEFKQYVIDKADYLDKDGKPVTEETDFMLKSRKIAREINVSMDSGRTAKKIVYEKQIVFWSKKYAAKARTDREKILIKAHAIANNPGKYTKATTYGAAKYVKNIEYDKETGEVIAAGKALLFDDARVSEEEKYDGYYSMVTSEHEMPDYEIIDKYRGLWEIEETFKIAKGTLETRPIYLSRTERIGAHFLTCYISLVILRLLRKLTGRRYSSEKIVDCLNRISCSLEEDNIYLFNYRSKISNDIGDVLGIDFSKKRLRLGEIKRIIGDTKK